MRVCEVVDVPRVGFVHGGGGLVEEEEGGLGEDRKADFDALQHAAAEVAELFVGVVLEAELLDDLGLGEEAVAEAEVHVHGLAQGQVGIEVHVRAAPGEDAVGDFGVDGLAVQAHVQAARAGGELAREHAHEGAFARAVGTGDEEAVPGLEMEVDVTENPVAVEFFPQALGLQFKHWLCRCLS